MENSDIEPILHFCLFSILQYGFCQYETKPKAFYMLKQQAHSAKYANRLCSHTIMSIPPLVKYIVKFHKETNNLI